MGLTLLPEIRFLQPVTSCRLPAASPARSPMTIQGAMVLPVITPPRPGVRARVPARSGEYVALQSYKAGLWPMRITA
jgi:hypothetical protein